MHGRRMPLRARNTLIFGLAETGGEPRQRLRGSTWSRIAAYCRVLAEQLRGRMTEMTDEWIHHLQLASSLHDIGKVGIPDQVLLKPGKLTPEERAVIERHPAIGATEAAGRSWSLEQGGCSTGDGAGEYCGVAS